MKQPFLFASILACFMLGTFACKKAENTPLLNENEIIGTWEVAGFGRSDGKTDFMGLIFNDDCRRVVFFSNKKVSVENKSGNSVCYSGTWEIIDHNGKNLKVADAGKAVEWKVWTVSDNQIAVQEGDINYNLLKK